MKNFLIVILVVLVVALVGVLLWQNWGEIAPKINPQKTFSCSSKTDCVLAYTGTSACAPCNQADASMKCVSPTEATHLQQERLKKHGQVYCELCQATSQEFTCACQGGSCVKVAKQQENPPVDETMGWKKYKNQQYGFELKLPSYFGEFKIATSSERDYRQIARQKIAYYVYSYSTTTPLVTMQAEDTRKRSGVGVEVSVFSADSYVYFSNLYDNINKNWYSDYWDDVDDKPLRRDIPTKDLNIVEINGWKGYRFGWGDMGGIENVVAVPHKDEVFEIKYSYSCIMEDCANPPECTEKIPEWLGCSENSQLKFEEILSTFKFN